MTGIPLFSLMNLDFVEELDILEQRSSDESICEGDRRQSEIEES